jgi:lipopolysaccharide assembly outer membrane protein LptD (OstA)
MAALASVGLGWASGSAQAQVPRPAAAASAVADDRANKAQQPIVLRAQELRGRPDLETVAQGDVEFRRGDFELRADWLSYEQADDTALARGQVRITVPSGVYSRPRGASWRSSVSRATSCSRNSS